MSIFRDVVAAHHAESAAVLVAAREPCLTIASDEQQNVHGRRFRIVTPHTLPELELPSSWIMAVLLCPGDDTRAIADWVRSTDRDARRVVFYFHPDTDVRAALAAWHENGLPVHSTWIVGTWRELHKHFGTAWNVRVFDDFRQR